MLMTTYLKVLGKNGLLVAFAACSGHAAAVEYNVSVGYSGEYTDNARRAADDEVSDVIHRPHVSTAIQHLAPRLELGADYRIQRRIYQDDTFENQNIAEGSGRVYWEVLPRHLTVFATDQRREREIRTAEQGTPDNLQETERSSAGATLSGNLIANQTASITYEHIAIDADQTNTDSQRDQITASYVVPRSSVEYFELSASRTDTDFDNPLAPDYQSVTGSGAWNRTTSRTHIRLRAGYTEVDREMQRKDVGSVVGGLEVSRTLSDQSVIELGYARNVADNSLNANARFIDLEGDVFVGDTDLNEVYTRDDLALTYTTSIGTSALDLVLFGAEDDYDDVDRDATRYGAHARISRKIRPGLRTNALVRYQRYRFEFGDQNQNQYQASIGFDWQVTRRLTLAMSGIYFARRIDASDADVDEWRGALQIDYLLLGTMR